MFLKILDDITLDRKIGTGGHLALSLEVFLLDNHCFRRPFIVAHSTDGLRLGSAALFQLLLYYELLENRKDTPVSRLLDCVRKMITVTGITLVVATRSDYTDYIFVTRYTLFVG